MTIFPSSGGWWTNMVGGHARQIRGISWSRADVFGLGACALGIAVLVPSLLSTSHSTAAGTTSIAETTFALAGVRRRPPSALVWDDLGVGDPIHEADTVFVPANAAASVRFNDGARMTLAPGSMVTLRLTDTPEISVARGNMTVESTTGGLRIRGAGGVVAVAAGSDARVAVGDRETRVEVGRGEARVEGRDESATITSGQMSSVDGAGAVATTAVQHALASPKFGQTIYYIGQPPALRLVWTKPAPAGTRIEIARDATFAEPESRRDVTGSTASVKVEGQGVFWWRLTDATGAAVSGSSMFVLVENEAPVLITPAAGATVHVPENQPLRLTWTESRGARSYELELAERETFADPVLTVTTTTNHFAVLAGLRDGRYFWRVRVADADRGYTPHSRAQSFWLVRRPILDAPGDLEIDVERAP